MSKSVELDKIIDAVTYEIGYPGHGSITLGDWAEAFVKSLSIQQEADAKLGAAVRKLLTDGQYDLRDSPKSFLSNCERLAAESITAMATPTDSEDK
jgi:adenylate kinase